MFTDPDAFERELIKLAQERAGDKNPKDVSEKIQTQKGNVGSLNYERETKGGLLLYP